MRKILALSVSAMLFAGGCDAPTAPEADPVVPAGLKLNVNPKKEVSFSIDVGAVERRKKKNIDRLRRKVTGCQEWTFDASGTLQVAFVKAAGNPLAQSRTDSLQVVKAKVLYPNATAYTSVMCILPSDVSALDYLHSLQADKQQRGVKASKFVTVAEYKGARSMASTASRELAKFVVNNGMLVTGSTPAAPMQALADNVLPTVMVYATYEWLDIPPVGVSYDPDDEPGIDRYVNPEEEFPSEPGEPYCGEPECWEDPPSNECNDPLSSFPPIAQEQLGKTADTKTAFCDPSSAASNRLCVDIWINKCTIGAGMGLGDCRDGTNADSERFRVRFIVDAMTGQMVGNPQVNNSCSSYPWPSMTFPPVYFISGCYGPGDYSITPSQIVGGTSLKVELTNGDWLARYGPSIDFTLDMKKTGDLLDLRFVGDGFPTIGFWRGYNGGWGNGIVLVEGHEFDLREPSTERQCRFTLR